MSELPESSDSRISLRADYAIAKRSTTLVARGLADLQCGMQSAETLMLIESGDIFDAIIQEDLDAVRQILDSDPAKAQVHLSEKDAEKYRIGYLEHDTPLHGAAAFKLPKIAQAIIAAGGDPNAHGSAGWTPLHRAISDTHVGCVLKIVDTLLDAGADANEIDAFGGSPLHECPDVDTARRLIAHGANVNAHSCTGETPLRRACEAGAIDLAEFLIEIGADPHESDSSLGTLLHRCGDVKIAKMLVAHGVDPHVANDRGVSPLHKAAYEGNGALAEFLMSIGADPNTQDDCGYSPLHEFSGMAFLAREFRLKFAPTFRRPINMAPFTEVARLLLIRGANPNIGTRKDFDRFESDKRFPWKRGATALHLAAWTGELALVRVLLDNGADPNLSNDSGVTPLQVAATEGHSEIVRELQAAGAKESDARTQSFD